MKTPFIISLREEQVRNKLQILILEKKVNISELTKSLGITRSTLYRYMEGSREFDIDVVIKIANILEVNLEDVVGQKCLICGEFLDNNVYTTDRLGLSTNKRKKTHGLEKDTLIYDCQNCGYIAFNHDFLEDFNYTMLSTAREYYALFQTVNVVRETLNLPWYKIMHFESILLEDDIFMEGNFVAYIETYEILGTIEYNPENKKYIGVADAELDLIPKFLRLKVNDLDKDKEVLNTEIKLPEGEDEIDLQNIE